MLEDEWWNEECGVMGVFGSKNAAEELYLGLFALQHRGQEACGIVTFDNNGIGADVELHDYKALGLLTDSFKTEDAKKLKGDMGTGHVRYSTQGGRLTQNIQPFIFRTPRTGPIAISHNGNLTNAKILRAELEENGSIFTTSSDSEVFIHLLAKSRRARLRERISDVVSQVYGAYSLIIAAKNRMYGLRDPYGFRPLVIGKKDEALILASETCALDLLGASYVRDVAPGELVRLSADGIDSFFPHTRKTTTASCAFEPIYFSRPDSLMRDSSVYEIRKNIGKALAKESAVEADMVVPIPDSGVPTAIGYAEQAKIPLELGLIRNHYVGRTFIAPEQKQRHLGVKLKLNPVSTTLKGQRVLVIDDSIVRGTTCSKIVQMLRSAGAREIHFRVGSPPISFSCHYGVSTPDRGQLLAAQKSLEEIRLMLNVDTMAYLSINGLKAALGDKTNEQTCLACFNGHYPEKIFTPIIEQPTDLPRYTDRNDLNDSTPQTFATSALNNRLNEHIDP